MLVTVSFPTIIYQLRSEKDHQKADGPGVRSPAPPPRKCPALEVRGIFIPLLVHVRHEQSTIAARISSESIIHMGHYEVVTDRDLESQSAFNRRFEWGPTSATLASKGITIIVDVLRFTSAVEAATSRGAVVFPYRWAEDGAQEHANSNDATLVNGSHAGGPSLSPLSLLALESQDRVVLPSPNGAACALLAAHAGSTVIASCLRNAEAVGRALGDQDGPITVIACGERWPDGTLRPALEDLLGAGAVLSKLGGRPSPDARSAIAAWRDAKHRVHETLQSCWSGLELQRKGASDDIIYCSQVNVSGVVPVLFNGAFRSASPEELLRVTINQ